MSNKERNVVIPSVFLTLKRNDSILMLRRFNTGFQDGQYTLPSGHVEKDETPTMAICREVKEEVGVDVRQDDVVFEQVLYRRGYNTTGTGFDASQTERVDFFFSTDTWEGEPLIGEPDKCDDVRWFSLEEIPDNTFPVVKEFFKNYPKQNRYEEAGYK